MSDILNINIESKDEKVFVSLNGEIDISNVKLLNEYIEKMYEQGNEFIVDFENLTYIDSTGLGALVHIYKALDAEGKKLTIKNVNDNIKKLFAITNLDNLIGIEE